MNMEENMKKLTEEQYQRFVSVRNRFLEDVSIFEDGILFLEKHVEHHECGDKLWLYKLKDTINALDFEKNEIGGKSFTDCDDFTLGIIIAKYFSKMEAIMLSNFGEVVSPFDKLLSEYFENIISILRT